MPLGFNLSGVCHLSIHLIPSEMHLTHPGHRAEATIIHRGGPGGPGLLDTFASWCYFLKIEYVLTNRQSKTNVLLIFFTFPVVINLNGDSRDLLMYIK